MLKSIEFWDTLEWTPNPDNPNRFDGFYGDELEFTIRPDLTPDGFVLLQYLPGGKLKKVGFFQVPKTAKACAALLFFG